MDTRPESTPTLAQRMHSAVMLQIRKTGLRGRLTLALLPPIMLILMATGYVSYKASDEFTNIAIERSVRQLTLALSHELEQRLGTCRTDLLRFAQEEMRPETLRAALERHIRAGGNKYYELCYLPASAGKPVIFINDGDEIKEIRLAETESVQPNPYLELDKLQTLAPGQVLPSRLLETTYPLPRAATGNLHRKTSVIRFYTPIVSNGTQSGLLFISIKATQLRNILSWYNSKESPLWAFPRSNALRFSYFLDSEGWILFQSGNTTAPEDKLETFLAREGYAGTLGRAGTPSAFRPADTHAEYWAAVREISEGTSGLQKIAEHSENTSDVDSFYFSYAPVRFRMSADGKAEVYGGVIFVDRSLLPVVAGYKIIDVLLIMTASSIILISLLIFLVGRIITRPVRALAVRLDALNSPESMEEIALPFSGYDITRLQDAVNSIIRRVRAQMEEIQAKDAEILKVNRRERATLDRERESLTESELSRIPQILGGGPLISTLKVNILKAAQVDVDVLISGETGTGKQLVAEAIHAHSARSVGTFVSINCGALDENLLLDALFGHVKGAFTEAKTDRSGAFQQADGGTLFLDEIQSASPKVQQSLLRAIASRKIKPLGSDLEIAVDVRIIAATNIDLPTLIEAKTFREDLYYRLKVVSIATPPLREHRENIPLLSLHYLTQARELAGRSTLDFSKGALAKLMAYDWPGNIRELVNCITRAAVMAEAEVIQPEEIRLDKETAPTYEEGPSSIASSKPRPNPAPTDPLQELNERQKAAWPQILRAGKVNRKGYQDMAGSNIPSRTATYDLQDFVRRGLLIKVGKGPTTHYEIAPRPL